MQAAGNPWLIAADILERTEAPATVERDWSRWLITLLPQYFREQFAEHHAAFWSWVWAITPGVRPAPFVAIWPRGGAKSTSAEGACVAIAGRGVRRYGMYVSGTQQKADDHVANVADMLGGPGIATTYPQLAARAVDQYGRSKGWRHNRLRTTAGFTLDAVGLDSDVRGVKLEDTRPDFIVIDDVDRKDDTAAATKKKLDTLTLDVLPAGAAHVAVLGIQNLVLPNGVFARLADGRADFLADRIVSGPVPALENFEVAQEGRRWVVVAGEATWTGMDRDACQAIIDTEGVTAFRKERQHEVDEPPGGMYDHLDFEALEVSWDDVPELMRAVVWVDPAVTNKDDSDSQGIQADALGVDDVVYRLFSWEDRTSPEDALKRAIRKALELGAEAVGVETDQGGDTWKPTFREAMRTVLEEDYDAQGEARPEVLPAFRDGKAGEGYGSKVHRSSQMLSDYERERIRHVRGTHTALRRALFRFPKTKPYDLADAAYWAWADLRGLLKRRSRARVRVIG